MHVSASVRFVLCLRFSTRFRRMVQFLYCMFRFETLSLNSNKVHLGNNLILRVIFLSQNAQGPEQGQQ